MVSKAESTSISGSNKTEQIAPEVLTEIEAGAFRRLLAHLDERKDVQNIDLMELAGFCRNCLSKWYASEAAQRGIELEYDVARERVYGMPYPEWKDKYQTPR